MPKMEEPRDDDNKKLGVIVEKLTSDAYSTENPPKDWCDLALLYPHEAIRRDMMALERSVAALDAESDSTWKAFYFCKWIINYFYVSVHQHHDNEELIYFPFLKTRAEIPEKEYGKSHKELMAQLDKLKSLAEQVVSKKGRDCASPILEMKQIVPPFVLEMKRHLQEEEETVPSILRAHFTKQEEAECVQQMIKKGGLVLARIEVPPIVEAMHEWATPALLEELYNDIPPPIRHLITAYYIPDNENYVKPMRDAPLSTDDKASKLHKTPCCRIPGCFPCIM